MPTTDEFFAKLDPSLLDGFTRSAYVFDLYDGDTVYYHVDLGYGVWVAAQTGRLFGLDAPELRPLSTRDAGQKAKDALWDFITRYALNRYERSKSLGHRVCLRSYPAPNHLVPDSRVLRKEKYGRWLVSLLGADDNGKVIDINTEMVKGGFARVADY